jgi:hypothetical protein
MKTARILFIMVGVGTLTLGQGFAGEPSRQPSERALRENHATSVRPSGPRHGGEEQMEQNSARSSQTVPNKTQSKSPLPNEFAQPMLKKAPVAANGGWVMNKTGSHYEQPAKLPGNGGTIAPKPGVSRNRSATPAAIGGLTTSRAKNSTAALDGAAMKRKL